MISRILHNQFYILVFAIYAFSFVVLTPFAGATHNIEHPDMPANVSALQLGFSDSVQVKWDASVAEGVQFYRVYRSTSSSSLGSRLHDAHGDTTFIDTSTAYNTTYYYRVVALLASIESDTSPQVSAKPVVPVPINVKAQDTTQGKEIKLNWVRPSDGLVLKFDVYRSTSSTSLGSKIKSGVSGTEYIDTNATNGTTYFYRIRSVVTNGKQSSDSETATAIATDQTRPIEPKLTATSSSNNGVKLSWNKPSNVDATRYRVYRSGTSTDLGDFIIETTAKTFTEKDLPQGTTYYYRVHALNDKGIKIVESNSARFRTSSIANTLLLPVTNTKASATGSSGKIKLTWKNPSNSNFSYVRIYRNTRNLIGSLIASGVRGSSFTDMGLDNGTTYYYAVVTVNNQDQERREVELVSAIPIIGKSNDEPDPVKELKVEDLGDGKSIKLTWINNPPHTYKYLNIYRSTDKDQLGEQVRTQFRGNEYIDTVGVQTNERYYFKVVPINTNGKSATQNPVVRGIATLVLETDTYDTDKDQLPDFWERKYGYHPHLKDDADTDDDVDGLGLLDEFLYGTNPWNSDTDNDGYNDGTEVANNYDPLGLGRKINNNSVSTPVTQEKQQTIFAYNKFRLGSVSEEQEYATELRNKLEQNFGVGLVPNPRTHWHKLVNAYIYGGYSAEEIAHTLRRGPGKVHPNISAGQWRKTGEYSKS